MEVAIRLRFHDPPALPESGRSRERKQGDVICPYAMAVVIPMCPTIGAALFLAVKSLTLTDYQEAEPLLASLGSHFLLPPR